MLITDGWSGEETLARVAAALDVLPPSTAVVQLRAKTLDAKSLLRAAEALRAVTRGRAALVVNDRVDVALAAGADGVHLPAAGLPVAVARRLVGGRLVVGVSTHALDEIVRAVQAGADYVAYGPVWPTASPGPKAPPVGIDGLARAVATAAPCPLFALGGVDGARAAEVVSVGARVACIGAVLGRRDAGSAAASLLAAIEPGAELRSP
jgi:thiamine-phosphate pyrophosphorylase